MLMLRSLLLLALSLPSITSHGVTEWKRGAAGIWHHRDDGHARVLGAHGVDNNTQRIQHKQFDTIFDSISANLTLSISTFSNNDPLTVAWTLLNRTSSWDPTHDWIGLFATDIAEGDSDYVDWVWTSTSPTNPQGYGSITFPHLVHLRSKYVVRYYTHTGLGYARIGESMILAPNDMAEPTHIHLALTEDPSRMTVSWTSSSTVYHSVQYRCEFPVSCDRGWQSVDSVFSTYAASDMCGFPANSTSGVAWFIPPGYLHTATLVSLCHPSCRYVYQIGIGDQWTDQYHFVTQKDAGDDVTVSFLAYGDMGEGAAPGASSTAARSLAVIQQCSQPPCVDGVLHIGDISYARGQALIWDTYMNFIQPITSSVPYMINIGNHEYDHLNGAAHDPSGAGLGFHPSWGNYHDDSSGECSVPVYHRFKMPMNGHGIYWYSFETGPVHVMMMSSEHAFDSLSDQYAWMEKDLASVNREITPWIILGGHRPMYCSEQYESDYQVALGMQRDFESLLYKYNVDIAIWGHYHSYERTCAVYNNTCDPKGTVHVVMGMAGASLDNVGYKNLSWSLYHDQVFGYTTLEVSRTTLKLSYYHNVDNALADSVVLTRSCSHVPFALVMRLFYSLSWMWFLVALSLLAMIGSAWTRGYKCSEWLKCRSCWIIWMSTSKTTSTHTQIHQPPQYRY